MDNNNKKTINNNNNNVEKMGETRTKPTRDITQIYTQGKKKINYRTVTHKKISTSRP